MLNVLNAKCRESKDILSFVIFTRERVIFSKDATGQDLYRHFLQILKLSVLIGGKFGVDEQSGQKLFLSATFTSDNDTYFLKHLGKVPTWELDQERGEEVDAEADPDDADEESIDVFAVFRGGERPDFEERIESLIRRSKKEASAAVAAKLSASLPPEPPSKSTPALDYQVRTDAKGSGDPLWFLSSKAKKK